MGESSVVDAMVCSGGVVGWGIVEKQRGGRGKVGRVWGEKVSTWGVVGLS